MISPAWWASSWNRRSLRRGTVCPRRTSMPEGSMPNLTRRGRAGGVVAFGGADLDEDDAAALDGDQVDLAVGAGVVAGDDAPALAAQEAGGGPLRAAAEPAPPPGLHGTPRRRG